MPSLSTIVSIISLIVMTVLLLGGAILLATRRKDHGRGAVMGMVGCIVLFGGVLINAFFAFGLPSVYESMGPNAYLVLVPIFSLVSLLLEVVGTGLLIFGVIASRNPAQPGGQAQQPWQYQPQPEWQQPVQHQPGQQQAGWQQPGWQQQSQPQPGWQPQPGPQPQGPQQPGPQQQQPFQQQPPGWQTPPQ